MSPTLIRTMVNVWGVYSSVQPAYSVVSHMRDRILLDQYSIYCSLLLWCWYRNRCNTELTTVPMHLLFVDVEPCIDHNAEVSLALHGSRGITGTAWLMRQHLHCVAHEPSLALCDSWAITCTAWLIIIYKSYDSCTVEVLSQYNQIRLTPSIPWMHQFITFWCLSGHVTCTMFVYNWKLENLTVYLYMYVQCMCALWCMAVMVWLACQTCLSSGSVHVCRN